MTIKISLCFFALFYCFLLLFAFFAKGRSAAAADLVYILVVLLLTIPRVQIEGGVINIVFGGFHAARVGLDLSASNVFLNLLLGIPLGVNGKTALDAARRGGAIGASVELFQLIFPFGRVVDLLDILLCALGALAGSLLGALKRRRLSLLL